jgi:hypothetical protein
VAIDAWTSAAGVSAGPVFRPVNRGDKVQGAALSEKVVWQLLRGYAATAGMPGIAPHDLRRSCATCAYMSRVVVGCLLAAAGCAAELPADVRDAVARLEQDSPLVALPGRMLVSYAEAVIDGLGQLHRIDGARPVYRAALIRGARHRGISTEEVWQAGGDALHDRAKERHSTEHRGAEGESDGRGDSPKGQ